MLRQRPGAESESIINKNNEEPNNKFSDSNPGHFSMVRNFYIADFLTLTNGACGVGTILSLLHYQTSRDTFHLWLAFTLIPIGVFFDVLDGRVARWRNESSLLGQELDSLADLVTFFAYSILKILIFHIDLIWFGSC
jgi:CDP-diacylglycerol--serine O-phosphatidyltransferase